MTKQFTNIVENINKQIGKDVENLHKAQFLIDSYKTRYLDIKAKLDLDDTSKFSNIKEALRNQKKTEATINFELEKISVYEESLHKKLNIHENVLDSVSDQLEKLNTLKHLEEYLKIVDDIQNLNGALTSAVNGKDDLKIITLYLSLYGDLFSNNSIIGRLQNVEAYFLKTFANKTAIYWYEIIKDKFSREFELILKQMKWPQQGKSALNFIVPKESINKLTSLAEHLFFLKPPNPEEELVYLSSTIVCYPLTTPVELLLVYFRQRFQYHFMTQRQTNRLDKPEWYFTQIINWIKENHLFIGKTFQPCATKAGHEFCNIRLQFIRGLVQLTIEKLINDIKEISSDEHLFAHLIDETLAFEQELRENFGYLNSLPSAIDVLTQPEYLLKWIAIEERFSTDKMDFILQTTNPWEYIDPIGLEELKIPKCADQFLRLLEAIKERYCCLKQPGHQLQFLDLQLELIDNFRSRLAQLYGCGNVGITKILNAINYIGSALEEWGENVHYLHLNACLLGNNYDVINNIFDKPVEQLKQWKQKLLKELSFKIFDEIKAKSMSYRHASWANTTNDMENTSCFFLSPSAGEMFQVMITSLNNLENELSVDLFTQVIRIVANLLDDFFIDSFIMNARFSNAGATQFNYDITKNLFPLFGQHIRRPDLLFKKLKDACVLLVMAQGNAFLLFQTLQEETSNESKLQALKELGIINLKPIICVNILERRNDMWLF